MMLFYDVFSFLYFIHFYEYLINIINDKNKHLTLELFSEATKLDITIFKRIINITNEILLYMICRNRLLFKFVDIEKYDDDFINLLYLNLLSKNGQSLKDIKKQTEDLCII